MNLYPYVKFQRSINCHSLVIPNNTKAETDQQNGYTDGLQTASGKVIPICHTAFAGFQFKGACIARITCS